MSVVESKLKLIKITIKMLHGDLVVGTNYRPLKETPNILQCVCMNDAAHIFLLKVIDRSVKCVVSSR